ncbi:hypothetical protein [Bradyrhizobium brasilense]|uniref:hypothetical protein n=1 Tax=Bradyrhizobium brasilense TaxID=1419277 RepID=UPI001E296A15|nr:hypothetical protein [Bradyrhizobium brasilense]MCC8968928.1 hypothetical protein [Bradyrhizobium brasilense]
MLSPHEFSVGHIGATTGLTLVLPADRYDHLLLVTTAHDEPTAIFLDDRHQFEAFGCEGNTNYKGILVPNVQVEVDETSAFDVSRNWAEIGCLVRKDDGLFMSTLVERRLGRNRLIALQRSLAVCEANSAIGFMRWQIVIGEGTNKRTLRTVAQEKRAG